MALPQIHLVEGPVGAGKSTYCMSLASRISGVHIALDEWFAKLFSPDRPSSDVVPWYLDRKERLLNHIWSHAQTLLASGTTPVLELGLVQRQSREEFYQRAREAGIELKIYILEASRETRRERVKRRNVERGATFSMVVPEPIFEIASDMWQSPDETEISENWVEIISTEPGHQ
ncbi:MAG: ATP-binding protein [Casimicrobium sp.]